MRLTLARGGDVEASATGSHERGHIGREIRRQDALIADLQMALGRERRMNLRRATVGYRVAEDRELDYGGALPATDALN